MSLSREQLIAARKALGWSREKLAAEAEVHTRTVANFENGNVQPYARSVHKIGRALKTAGVEFVDGEPGVTLKAQ